MKVAKPPNRRHVLDLSIGPWFNAAGTGNGIYMVLAVVVVLALAQLARHVHAHEATHAVRFGVFVAVEEVSLSKPPQSNSPPLAAGLGEPYKS
jgi:hypothetical protein